MYLARRPLFESRLREIAAAEIGAALDADVEIGAISGSWLFDVTISGIRITGERTPVTVNDGELAVRLAPLSLIAGDLSGLRSARLRASEVRVREPRTASEPEPTGPTQPFDAAALGRTLESLLVDGAAIDIDVLDLELGGLRRRGPISARLQPGNETRELRVLAPPDRLRVTWLPQRGWSARGQIAQPGQILRDLGVDQPLQDGSVGFDAGISLAPLAIEARVEVVGSRWGASKIAACRLAGALDGGTLRLRETDVRLPGIALQTRSLVLPSPLAPGFDVRALRGELQLALADFDSDLLPAEVRAHAPLRGMLTATCRDGILRLQPSTLEGPTARLQIESGTLPIETSAQRAGGYIRFTADIPNAAAFGPVTLAGKVLGSVEGSLAAPKIDVAVDATALRYDDFTVDTLSGDVLFENAEISLQNLNARGIGAGRDAALAGTVRVTLASQTTPARVRADVTGTMDPALLDQLGVGLPPEVRPTAPFAFSADGQVILADRPTGVATITVNKAQLGEFPPLELHCNLSALTDRIEIETLRISGPTELTAHGTVPLDPAAPLRLQADAMRLRPELLPLGLGVHGTLDANIQLEGTLADPVAAIALSGRLDDFFVDDPARWPIGAPPSGPLHFALTASHGPEGIAVKRLSASAGTGAQVVVFGARGVLPLRWADDRGLHAVDAGDGTATALTGHAVARIPDPRGTGERVSLGIDWTLTADRLTLGDLRLVAVDGLARGDASVAAGATQLLEPKAWLDAKIAGKMALSRVRLESWLPRSVTGLPILAGKITGTASVDGSLRELRPHLDAQLTEGNIKIPGLPRLESLSAKLSTTGNRLEVERASAKMGAGAIRVSGSVESAGGPLWTLPEDAVVDVTLEGDEALLVRAGGIKLRGDAALKITGTFANLLVGGHFTMTSGKLVRRQTLLPDLRARGGATDSIGFVPFRIPPPFGERLRFDVEIETREPFEIATHVFDSALNGVLRLRGPGIQPYFEGSISGSSGRLRLPGATLDVQSILVSATESHALAPSVRMIAEGQRHGVSITLQVRGRYPDFEVELSSVPAMTRDDILVLLSTGVLPDRLRNATSRERAQILASYLATELVALYYGSDSTERDEGFASRFEIEYGSEISKNGLESIVVEFALNDHFALQAERDVYEDYNMGIVLRFRF